MPRRKPPTRRRKGEGSPRYDAKNKRYIWRITHEGKRYEVADRDPERAKARFEELVELLNRGVSIEDTRQSLRAYTEYYLANILPNEVDESTVIDYAKRAGYYILPTLGGYALADIKKPLVQAWVNAMLDHGWAISSIRQALSLLKRILETTVPEILEYNPAAQVKPPKVLAPLRDDDDEDEGRTLTEQEVALVLKAVTGTFYEALYTLAVRFGLRRGELLGLRWQDIDVEKQELRVRQQVRRMNNVIAVSKRLKTKNSRRTLPLAARDVALLKAHQARVYAMRLKAGAEWVEHDFVFPNDRGGHRRPDNLTTHCSRLLKRLEIEGHHLHDLRATAITRWRNNGIADEVMAAMAGHDNVKVTVNNYLDVIDDRKRAVIERLG